MRNMSQLVAVAAIAVLTPLAAAAQAKPPAVAGGETKQTATADQRNRPDLQDGIVRGVVRGLSEVTMAADIVARVLEAPLRDGDQFKKGDLLVRFDCIALEAERDATLAAHRGHKNNYESNLKLKKYGAGSQFAIISAKSDMEKAEAEVRRLEARLRVCTIEAPFDGRIIERVVSPHETPGSNQPLIRIVDDSDLVLQLVVPSRWLAWLKPGIEFPFIADETGKTYMARLNLIGAVVDPVSQTVRLRCSFVARAADILTGMSGSAQFNLPREIALTR